MALPHFGQHQPEDTYCYTPTKLEGFGLCFKRWQRSWPSLFSLIAVAVLNKSQHVTVSPINPSIDWFYYYTLLMKPYKMMSKAGLRITTNHIFWLLLMRQIPWSFRQGCWTCHNTGKSKATLWEMTLFRKANVADSSYEHWLQAMLCTKACPGYKQVMMHKNYLTFVPQEYNTD